MAPVILKRLIAVQKSRLTELELTCTRLRERPHDSFNLNIATARCNTLEKMWNEARSAHTEIMGREEAANDPYVIDGMMTRMQIIYEDTFDFLLTLQSDLAPVQPAASNITQTDFEPRMAKLPKLDLPSFSGQYAEWENFCDLFTTLVHNAPRLSDATKLQYLKTCLKGTATDLVKEVATTDANYITTWEALKSRFYNPRLIVYNHFQALLDIPRMKRESATELRTFADEAQRIVRALTNLKLPVEQWDVWLVFTLASRLDPESRKMWESNINIRPMCRSENILDHFPKFSQFAEFLEYRARTLSMIASETSKFDERGFSSNKPTVGSRRIHHAFRSQSQEDDRLKCPLCSGAHGLHKCYKFKAKTLHDRREDVTRLRLCYNCFGKHRVRECKALDRCMTCEKRHHTLIHMDRSGNDSLEKDVVECDKRNDGISAELSGINIHTASLSVRKHSVILATAQLLLVGPNGKETRVRALLDQGSEASFVTDNIACLVDLNKRRVNVPLTGLGTSRAGTARHATQMVLRSLINPSFEITTDALVLQKLTSQLPARRPIGLDLTLFKDLTLADPGFYVPDTVNMILGADVYGQLLRPGIRKFVGLDLIAQETAFGWVISGPLGATEPRRAEPRAQEPCRTLHCAADDNLDTLLERFWNIEDCHL